MTMRILTELKARKAKFGFKKDSVRVEDFIILGRLMEGLQDTSEDFTAEMTGMNKSDFRLYTDNEDVADFVRRSFC